MPPKKSAARKIYERLQRERRPSSKAVVAGLNATAANAVQRLAKVAAMSAPTAKKAQLPVVVIAPAAAAPVAAAKKGAASKIYKRLQKESKKKAAARKAVINRATTAHRLPASKAESDQGRAVGRGFTRKGLIQDRGHAEDLIAGKIYNARGPTASMEEPMGALVTKDEDDDPMGFNDMGKVNFDGTAIKDLDDLLDELEQEKPMRVISTVPLRPLGGTPLTASRPRAPRYARGDPKGDSGEQRPYKDAFDDLIVFN